MTIRNFVGAAALVATFAMPVAAAPMMTAKQFVAKAGASDMAERKEAALMSTSSNTDIATFAKQMTTDHTKSTEMVKAAAKKDGIKASPPMMTAKQKSDYAALAASSGAARDSLYVTQQKAAHAEALDLMQSYSTSGKAAHLKMAAEKITPVVQSHVDMLDKMAM